MEKIFNRLDNSVRDEALWVVGNGGTGKSSLLKRLGIELANKNEPTFFINGEKISYDPQTFHDILIFIKEKTKSGKAHILIDNPDTAKDFINSLFLGIRQYTFQFLLIFVERENRYTEMLGERMQCFVAGQTTEIPVSIINSKRQREKVYKRFQQTLGTNDERVPTLIKQYALDTDQSYVNASYKILTELNKEGRIHFVFDWQEYARVSDERFPSLKKAYKYIALLYLFAVKTPLELLTSILKPEKKDIDSFIEYLKQDYKEPLILEEREEAPFTYAYKLRTKHEIVSELFFENNEVKGKEIQEIKTRIMAEIIQSIDFHNIHETNVLIYIFGNKRIIREDILDYKKLFDLLFSDVIIAKVKRNPKLYETLHLSFSWFSFNNNNINKSVEILKKGLIELPNRLHMRTELAKIYQHQNKFEEAEKYLLEYLDLDKKGLHPRTELAKIYQHQNKFEEAEKILMEILHLDPKNLQARTELAKIYQHQNKFEEAETMLLACLKLRKNDLNSRTELSKLYQLKKDFLKAEARIKEILAIKKTDAFAMSELIKVYLSLSRPRYCFKRIDLFLLQGINTRKAQPLFTRILTLCEKTQRFDKGREYFELHGKTFDMRNNKFFEKDISRKKEIFYKKDCEGTFITFDHNQHNKGRIDYKGKTIIFWNSNEWLEQNLTPGDELIFDLINNYKAMNVELAIPLRTE